MPAAATSLLFWIAAGALASLAAWLIMRFAARAAEGATGGAPDPARAVYQRQIEEIDVLADQGLIPEHERSASRTEAARRLLTTGGAPAEGASQGARRLVLIGAGAAALIALVLYLGFGSPGTQDQAYRTRLTAWRRAEPAALKADEIAAVLRDTLRQRPTDVRLLYLLGNVERAAGDPTAAGIALARAAKLDPANADLQVALGDALEAQAGGKPSPEGEAAFQRALHIDPKNQAARYFLGGAKAGKGDGAGAAALWRSLAADLPATDARRAGLIALAERTEHSQAAPPTAAPSVANVSPDQGAFIRAMVASLAAKLDASPDDPAGWARLVRSYGVLHDDKAQAAALARARTLFAKRPADLQRIEVEVKR